MFAYILKHFQVLQLDLEIRDQGHPTWECECYKAHCIRYTYKREREMKWLCQCRITFSVSQGRAYSLSSLLKLFFSSSFFSPLALTLRGTFLLSLYFLFYSLSLRYIYLYSYTYLLFNCLYSSCYYEKHLCHFSLTLNTWTHPFDVNSIWLNEMCHELYLTESLRNESYAVKPV